MRIRITGEAEVEDHWAEKLLADAVEKGRETYMEIPIHIWSEDHPRVIDQTKYLQFPMTYERVGG